VFARQARFSGERTKRARTPATCWRQWPCDAAGEQNAALGRPAQLREHRLGEIGIVAGFRGIAAEVDHLMTEAGEPLPQFLFEGKTAVIRRAIAIFIKGETPILAC